MSGWREIDVPDQAGRTVVVTGANSGIGFHAARVLATRGARVVLAVRNPEKGEAAARRIPGETEVRPLDLTDLDSVRAFAEAWEGPLDLLVNNAGIMAPPLERTKAGFESQFGTNHLGHFALTGRLLPALLESAQPRVVTVSSSGHRMGRLDLDDLAWERRRYSKWVAYGTSKLANLLFAFELQRRADDANTHLLSLAAHPGLAATNLIQPPNKVVELGAKVVSELVAQSSEAGALPTLYAASMDLPGAAYVGPDGVGELRGSPQLVGTNDAAKDPTLAAGLWARSEALTGVSYDFAALPV